MNQVLEPTFETAIQPYLTEGDDPAFWLAAFAALSRDLELLHLDAGKNHDIFLQVGACSHWLRPHQTRLAAAGGFAYPSGYLGSGHSRHGLPEFDWFVLLYRDQKEGRWIAAEKFFGKRKLVCRIALPTRTIRHHQAAVHVLWSPGTPEHPDEKQEMFYGFKKVGGEWKCVAAGAM